MKKFVAILAVCFCLMLMNGCFLESCFNGGESSSANSGNSLGGGNSSTDYSISVVYDDETLNYSFNEYSKIKIAPKYKDGYVLNGFYTQKSGQGTQLLNYLGENVSSNWLKSGTNILYPYYVEINKTYIYKSSIAQEESAGTYSYNVYGNPKTASWTITAEKLDYIYKIAVANPYIKMKITAFADFYDEATKLILGIGSDISTGKLVEKSFPKTSSFTTQSVSAEITGKTIINNLDKK